jgi:hypothetical protein
VVAAAAHTAESRGADLRGADHAETSAGEPTEDLDAPALNDMELAVVHGHARRLLELARAAAVAANGAREQPGRREARETMVLRIGDHELRRTVASLAEGGDAMREA